MIAKITLVTCLLFASIYPLCFWISFKDPLKNKFHKFHLGLPNVVAGVTVISILFMPFPLATKILALIWKASLLGTSRFYWKKDYPDARVMTIPCVLGLLTFTHIHMQILSSNAFAITLQILSGFIFASSLYAMNLGHWYLNVHGLPIKHLKNAAYVFWSFLALRLGWDAAALFMEKILYSGEYINLLNFTFRLDGFLIWVAILFGTVFPLCGNWFAMETLKLKNTQSATGILYVLLCSVLIGDISYKYYLIKFGVIL